VPVDAQLVKPRVQALDDGGVVLGALAARDDLGRRGEVEEAGMRVRVPAEPGAEVRPGARNTLVHDHEEAVAPIRLGAGDGVGERRVVGVERVRREVDRVAVRDVELLNVHVAGALGASFPRGSGCDPC